MGCGGVHQQDQGFFFVVTLPMMNLKFNISFAPTRQCVVALTVQFLATKTFTAQVPNLTVGKNHSHKSHFTTLRAKRANYLQ